VKTGAGQTIVKIQGSITQVWDTLAIDKKLHPIPFHHGVAVLFVIKRHLVLQTRTAAFCDLNAQTFPGIFRPRFEQTSELPNCVVRDVNHLYGKYGTGVSKSKACKHGRFCFSSQFVSQKLRFKIA
jgi:hypothetical protein